MAGTTNNQTAAALTLWATDARHLRTLLWKAVVLYLISKFYLFTKNFENMVLGNTIWMSLHYKCRQIIVFHLNMIIVKLYFESYITYDCHFGIFFFLEPVNTLAVSKAWIPLWLLPPHLTEAKGSWWDKGSAVHGKYIRSFRNSHQEGFLTTRPWLNPQEMAQSCFHNGIC